MLETIRPKILFGAKAKIEEKLKYLASKPIKYIKLAKYSKPIKVAMMQLKEIILKVFMNIYSKYHMINCFKINGHTYSCQEC